jgi:nucleoside-diphosphate-sugar epimerase
MSTPGSFDINVTGSIRLAQECVKARIRRFVFVSTGHVYSLSDYASTELSPLEPISEYALQKLEAEEGIRLCIEGSMTELVVVRLFSIIGRGMPSASLGGQIDRAASKSNEGVIKYADDSRSFLSIETAARHLEQLSTMPNISGVFNLCSSQPILVRDAVSKYVEIAGLPHPLLAPGNSEVPVLWGDNSKLLNSYAKSPALIGRGSRKATESLRVLEFEQPLTKQARV